MIMIIQFSVMMVLLLLTWLGDVLVAGVVGVPGSLVLEVLLMVACDHILVGGWL